MEGRPRHHSHYDYHRRRHYRHNYYGHNYYDCYRDHHGHYHHCDHYRHYNYYDRLHGYCDYDHGGNGTAVVELKWEPAGIYWEGLAQGAAAHFCVRGVHAVRYGKYDGYALYLSGYARGAGSFIHSAGPYEGGWWWVRAERWWGGYDAGYAYFKLGSNNTCLWLFVELRNNTLYYGYALLNTSSVEAAYRNATWFFKAAANSSGIIFVAATLAGFGDGDWVEFNGTVYTALYIEVDGRWVPAQARPGSSGLIAERAAYAWVSARGNCAAISWPEPAQPVCP